MKKYNYAILKTPSEKITNIEGYGNIAMNELFKQHDTLVNYLKNIGIKVHVIHNQGNDEWFTNISDICLTTRKCSILLNSNDAVINNYKCELASHLSRFYPLDRIHYITFPAIVSNRDILVVNDTYYIALSSLTNLEGAEKMREILERYKFRVVIIQDCIEHIKDYINYVEYNNLLVKEGYNIPGELQEFNIVPLDITEQNGIGSLWVNDTIIIPNNCQKLKSYLNSLNKYAVVGMNDTELWKIGSLIKRINLLF